MNSEKTQRESRNGPNQSLTGYELVLHNDDVHCFEYVIESLTTICEHTPDQAMQCTLIAHHKGCCTVRSGDMELLQPMKEALTERKLTVTINVKS